jgi:DNA modification methylase
VISYTFSLRPLAELTPNPKNARSHSPKQIDALASSIDASAFGSPIIIDEAGVIISGHGRRLAAEKLDRDVVPVVTITGLSEDQKRLLRVADNKIALLAGWDIDLLKVEIEDILASGLDIELSGFTIGEIDVVLEGAADPDDDVIPATPAEPVTRLGDKWLLGHHAVICGDVRDHTLRQRLMGSAMADAAFLDAPYNVKVDGHAGGRGKTKHREFAFASGEMTRAQFINFLTQTHRACVDVSRPGAVHFTCMDHRHMEEMIVAAGNVYGKRLNLCVWVKSNAGQGSLYRSHHELVFAYRVGDAPHRNNVELGKHGRNRTNVWEYASVNTFKGSRRHDLAMHPTCKPVQMVADALKDVTRPGEIVLDGFLGSGTTLIACERTGRACRGVEIDPIYVDTIIARFAALTGIQAILEETGETFDQVRARRAIDGGEG